MTKVSLILATSEVKIHSSKSPQIRFQASPRPARKSVKVWQISNCWRSTGRSLAKKAAITVCTSLDGAVLSDFSRWTFNNLKFTVLQPFLPSVAKFSTFWPQFDYKRSEKSPTSLIYYELDFSSKCELKPYLCYAFAWLKGLYHFIVTQKTSMRA